MLAFLANTRRGHGPGISLVFCQIFISFVVNQNPTIIEYSKDEMAVIVVCAFYNLIGYNYESQLLLWDLNMEKNTTLFFCSNAMQKLFNIDCIKLTLNT